MRKTYIDMDSLFDTRIALIQMLDKKVVRQIAKNKDYFRRLDDDFFRLDSRIREIDWKGLWLNRGQKLNLELLTCTGVYLELKKERTEKLMMKASGIDIEAHSITFNTWPYKLEEEDRKALAEILIETTECHKVNFISLAPEMVTTDFFHSGFDTVIMYDLNAWLDMHFESLAKDPLLKTQFIAPLMFKGEGKPDMELGELIETAREQLKPYFKYNPMPVETFCFMTQ